MALLVDRTTGFIIGSVSESNKSLNEILDNFGYDLGDDGHLYSHEEEDFVNAWHNDLILAEYIFVDAVRGDEYEKFFETFEEAEKAAYGEWNHLTDHDKKQRNEFFIAVPADGYGTDNYDLAEMCIDFLEDGI